jgi:hypothetical protein
MFDPGAWTDEVPAKAREGARARHDELLGGLRLTFDGRALEVKLPPGRDPGSFDREALRGLVRAAAAEAGFNPKIYDL